MSSSLDRLYQLLPAVYRQRDAEQGRPLQALLQVITEQVDVVEADIAQLYENWFIETCQDWVVPYIGDLIGYRPVREAGEPGNVSNLQGQQRHKILIPRREVANTIRYRRRKGTLALLELLASDIAGWPARAVEFYKLLGLAQAINHPRLERGRTVDLRQGDALDCLDGYFDSLAHTVDVRRIISHRTSGRYNIPSVGLFVWRLQPYSVTRTRAYCLDEFGSRCYTFSVLGNDTPLYTYPERETEPTHIAEELNLPVPIRRRAFEEQTVVGGVERKQAAIDYYGEGKSLVIWAANWGTSDSQQPILPESVIPADLSDWEQYLPPRDRVGIDPKLGRIVFPRQQLPTRDVWVSYYYGFSADMGGGEYDRHLSQPTEHQLYQVPQQLPSIRAAIDHWQEDWQQANPQRPAQLRHAVIEITDSGVYEEQININLDENQSLQIRAANRTRPVIRLLDYKTDALDFLSVTGGAGSRFTLDGLLITGRGVRISRREDQPEGDLAEVAIRHSTLVPGWGLHSDCQPRRPAKPSLEVFNTQPRLVIEHSIIGSIQINENEVKTDPIHIQISDSILDATSPEREALGAPGYPAAHAILTIVRSTVFGQIQVHAIDLAENSIFNSPIKVARRQRGCMSFCYYVKPGSRTPRCYNCQPDLVEEAVVELINRGELSPDQKDHTQQCERLRVQPQFNSTRYGTPTYCQLSDTCSEEIKGGADDEAEMGVFHDLYQPQRAANLLARLDEYVPADTSAGIIYAS